MSNITVIKDQMKRLWCDTFHDSELYVDLIFDSYYDSRFVEYAQDDSGNIKAALLGVPYEFGLNNNTIKGVYLCGLATKPEFRNCGIMTNLIERISARMRGEGYSFLFLIPADESLSGYYEKRGFVPAFYRRKLNFASSHDFTLEYFRSLRYDTIDEKIDAIRHYEALSVFRLSRIKYDLPNPRSREKEVMDQLCGFIFECENRSVEVMPMFQNRKQIETFIKEAIISGGDVSYVRSCEGKLKGVAVWEASEHSVTIKHCFVNDAATFYKLAAEIKEMYKGKPMVIIESGGEGNREPQVWRPYYPALLRGEKAVGEVGEHTTVFDTCRLYDTYGMLRILSVSEILKFAMERTPNLKYSILAQQEKSDKICRYTAEDGHLTVDIIEKGVNSAGKSDDAVLDREVVLSWSQLGKILFRRCGNGDDPDAAFGLPAISTSIFLMLD